jgi:hypothetical protein
MLLAMANDSVQAYLPSQKSNSQRQKARAREALMDGNIVTYLNDQVCRQNPIKK